VSAKKGRKKGDEEKEKGERRLQKKIQMRKNGNNIFMGINNITDSDTEVEAETDEVEEGALFFP